MPTLSREIPQDHSDDPYIEQGDDQAGNDDGHSMDYILSQNHRFVCRGQAQHKDQDTEDLMDLVGSTERHC